MPTPPCCDELDQIPEELARIVRGISMLVLDVDGVLTDGGLYYSGEGIAMKRFDVQDGLGLGILRRTGVGLAVITGQAVAAVDSRMCDLKILDYYAGYLDKRQSLEEVRVKHSLSYEQMAFVGDDWVDLPALRQVGLPLAVANAQPEVKALARYVTRARGGHGAVREIVRLFLHCRGQLPSLIAQWTEGLSL